MKIKKKLVWPNLSATLKENDVIAFGIMDYWTFDGYLALMQYLKANSDIDFPKAIFPGMELRIESPTTFRMNIHVLLDNCLTAQSLMDFKSELKLRIGGKLRSLSDDSLIDLARSLDNSKATIYGFKPEDLKLDF